MADQPAGFSSPMGGSRKKASAAAASALHDLMASSKSYADNMERAAKAAERVAHAQGKGTAGSAFFSNLLGQGGPATGGSSNGGGASVPPSSGGTHWINQHQPGSPFPMIGSRPPGFGGGMGATLNRPANGGGANMPRPPSFNERVSARAQDLQVEQAARAQVNGGGATFGASFHKASPLPNEGGIASALGTGLGTAAGAAIGGMVASTGTYSSYDYLANRIALLSAGAYSKQSGAMQIRSSLGGAFRNTQEMNAQGSALLGGGFTAGSAGWNTQASSIRSIASLDPNAAATAGRVATSFQQPAMFNQMRMLGIQTMGAGGKPKSVNDIARQLYQQSASRAGVDPSKAPSVANVAAYFGPGGSLATTASLNGWNQEQTAAVQTSLLASARAGHFITDREAQSRNRGKNPFGDTMYGSQQDREKGTAAVITAGLKDFADGYITANKGIGTALEHLGHSIDRMPELIKKAIFGGAGVGGAAVHGGGAVSNAVGGALWGAGMEVGGHLLKRGARAIRDTAPEATGAAETVGKATGEAGSLLGKVGGLGKALGIVGAAGAAWNAGHDLEWYVRHGFRPPKHKGHAWEFWKGNDYSGDGPGFSGASFPGVAGAGFRGREWGDGPGSTDAQTAAAKARGGETVGLLEEMLKGYKGGAIVTSAKRTGKSGVTVSGNVSYHATGNAIDIAATTPGRDSPELLAINKYFAQYASGLNELIYAGPGGTLVKDGRRVGPGFYGKNVMDIHHNHVHVAATVGMLKKLKRSKSGGFLSKALGGLKDIASSALHGVESLFGGGKAKPAVKDASPAVPSLGSMLARRGMPGGSQASLISQLLADVGPTLGSDLGSHRTVVDPTESDAPANGASSKTGAVTSMPVGTARDNALTIIKVAKEMGISKRGAIIGIATAEQESGLINLHSGDRDSQGLFQQRPSQGWGTVAQVTNPAYAARSFFERLKGTDYNHLPLTKAAQDVQRSAYPDAYAKWENTATNIVNNSHLYGDGPGQPGAMAATTVADVPTPRAHAAQGSGGNMVVHSRGGSSVTIAKVEVHLTTPQVSPQEARRIGKMVVDEIASQARMKELSR